MKKLLLMLLLSAVVLTVAACEGTTTTEETRETTTMSDEAILQEVLNDIEIPEVTADDLDLQDTYVHGGTEVSAEWHSTASSTITADGVVTQGKTDRDVTLTVTLSLNDAEVSEQYTVTVLSDEAYLVLFAVMQSLVEVPEGPVDGDIVLPETYELDGKTVDATWESSDPDVLSDDGTVTLGEEQKTIALHLTLEYDGRTREKDFSVTVAQDPSTLPSSWWHTAPVYTGIIEDEAPDPETPSCFDGAVYRKIVSNKDAWLGIEATLTVPEFIPDPQRVDSDKPSYYLDNASIYMGGNAYYESDVGLAWSIGYENEDSAVYSDSGIAFRPFWRYITSEDNIYRGAPVGDFEYYYFPGDKVQMSVFSPEPGFMQMRIELLEETTHPDYINRRDDYGLDDDFPRVFLTDPFPSAGMGAADAEFKRVNAIDQVANEGKPTINTNSQVIGAVWHEVYLYRIVDGELSKVPFTDERSASMTCPLGSNENGDFSDAFEISYEGVDPDLGGEVVTLDPDNGDGTLYNTAVYIHEDARKKRNI